MRRFGEALGLLDYDDQNDYSVMNAWSGQFPHYECSQLCRQDVECLQDGVTGIFDGYGQNARAIASAVSSNNGQTWTSLASSYSLFAGTPFAPAIEGNENASSSSQAYLAAWLDSDHRIVSRLGDGLWFDPATERTYTGALVYQPISLTYGAGYWMMAYIDEDSVSPEVRVRYSTNGTTFAGVLVNSSFHAVRVSVAYNNYAGRFVLAVLQEHGTDEGGEYLTHFYTSSNLASWSQATTLIWGLSDTSIACAESTDRCVLGYSLQPDPRSLGWRRFFVNSSGTITLSMEQGTVDGNSSYYPMGIAYQRYDTFSGEGQSVFVWVPAPPPSTAITRSIQRSVFPYVWSYSQYLPLLEIGGGRPSITSGEYYNEHLALYAYEP